MVSKVNYDIETVQRTVVKKEYLKLLVSCHYGK